MKTSLLFVGIMAAACAQAAAQDQPAPPPPPPEAAAPPHAAGGGPHGRGPHDRGPRGWHQAGKGFELDFGRGAGLKVDCGDEPIKACIDAAKVLIDKFPAYDPEAAMAGRRGGDDRGRGRNRSDDRDSDDDGDDG
jgi:hypothetical protein